MVEEFDSDPWHHTKRPVFPPCDESSPIGLRTVERNGGRRSQRSVTQAQSAEKGNLLRLPEIVVGYGHDIPASEFQLSGIIRFPVKNRSADLYADIQRQPTQVVADFGMEGSAELVTVEIEFVGAENKTDADFALETPNFGDGSNVLGIYCKCPEHGKETDDWFHILIGFNDTSPPLIVIFDGTIDTASNNRNIFRG